MLLVLARQDHAGQSAPTRTGHLLLDAGDREDVAGQRDLAGHGQLRPHPTPGERPHQRDPARGPVLRLRGRLSVHVQVGVPEVRRVEAVPPGVGPDPAAATRTVPALTGT